MASLNECIATVPSGDRWHKTLLDSSLHKGFVTQQTYDGLLKFLAFRHFYTHAYSIDIDRKKLAVLVKFLNPVFKAFVADLCRCGVYKNDRV